MTDDAIAVSGDDEALAGFLHKWLERWPEWPLVDVFVPREQRETAIAWAALQQELLDAAWAGTDARPGELKLAWWAEELHGWSQGRRRHPLGRVLQRRPAPWAALAAALPALRESRDRPGDADDALASIAPAAEAAAQVDAALFGEPPPVARAVALHWLAWRVIHEGEPAVPLAELARAGQDDAVALWRKTLLDELSASGPAPRVRRLWGALARLRLRAAAGKPAPSWRVLWSAWRTARN